MFSRDTSKQYNVIYTQNGPNRKRHEIINNIITLIFTQSEHFALFYINNDVGNNHISMNFGKLTDFTEQSKRIILSNKF